MWSSNMAGPLQFVFEFEQQLDADRLIAAYRETAREFGGVDGILVKVDEHTLGLDVAGRRSSIRATVVDPDIPLEGCIDSVQIGLGQPVARALVTTRRGRTTVGLSMSHVLTDGYGLFLFLGAWAARVRNGWFASPHCDRSVLTRPEARTRTEVDPEALRRAGFVAVDPDLALVKLPLHASRIPLADLPSAAGGSGVSSSDLLAASLFREYAATKDVPLVTLAYPVDIRRHVPDLGSTYFGNGFIQVMVDVETTQARTAPLPEIAGWLRAAVASVPDRIDAAVIEIEAFLRVSGVHALPQIWGYPPKSGFLVSNVSRIPMEWVDFGAGPPSRMATPWFLPRQDCSFVLPDPGRANALLLVSTLE